MTTNYNLWYENLPDGMHDVIVGPQGGLFLAGFDSRRRVCLVLYAPPFGQPPRTVTELPYRDYGRYTPTVLAARDPRREGQLLVLLYQHPDNLGIEQTSLYRIDPASGQQTLLAASSSPYWAPVAMLPRQDGPILRFGACNESACEPAEPLLSAASNATGKAGLTEVRGRLCLVVGSSAVLGTGGRLVCERPDGSLQTLVAAGGAPPRSGGAAGGAANASARASSAAEGTREADLLRSPSTLARGADGSLYAVSHGRANAYGYDTGSIHLLEPRGGAQPGAACDGLAASEGDDLCWHPPRLLISALSNPRGIAVDPDSDKLYVVEQNSLRGFSFETFHGDVLVFCARGRRPGRYDCATAQNSGECACRPGLGGNCCDVPLGDTTLAGALGRVQAAAGPWAAALLPVVAAVLALLALGLQRRRRQQAGRSPEAAGTAHGGAGGRGAAGDPLAELRVPLRRGATGTAGAPPVRRGSAAGSELDAVDADADADGDVDADADAAEDGRPRRVGSGYPAEAASAELPRPTSVHDALNLLSDTCQSVSPHVARWHGGASWPGVAALGLPGHASATMGASGEAAAAGWQREERSSSTDLSTDLTNDMYDFSRRSSGPW